MLKTWSCQCTICQNAVPVILTLQAASFFSKDEVTNFNNDIAGTNDFKSFKYKPKLLGETEADGVNGKWNLEKHNN